jgi:hypothetical protein
MMDGNDAAWFLTHWGQTNRPPRLWYYDGEWRLRIRVKGAVYRFAANNPVECIEQARRLPELAIIGGQAA